MKMIESEREDWNERAAIIEHDGEKTTAEAEKLAYESIERKRIEGNDYAIC